MNENSYGSHSTTTTTTTIMWTNTEDMFVFWPLYKLATRTETVD